MGKEGTKNILIADDDHTIRNMLREFLADEGFAITEAQTGNEVITAISNGAPDLVLMDVRMPELDGLAVLEQMQSEGKQVPMILMTAYGTSSLAIKAMQAGAYDYITKPFDLDDVLITIKRCFEHQELASQVKSLQGMIESRKPEERLIGNSGPMQEIYKIIGRVAASEATVLISGETGTGKELIAQVIHRASSYSHGPLIKVNCAALPETLLESELFGHEKGSFTGAITQRKGRFELAHKGSIFLDEVGEMSLSTQKKLLRVLQEREFERVGGSIPIKVDVRVIAASNKRLHEEVAAGRFREDLFYRLNVVSIELPPLRDRKDDIPLLVEHFLDKHRYSPTSPPARISEDAMQILEQHDWPGNVRELENTIERASIMARGGVITREHIVFSPVAERKFIDVPRMVKEQIPLTEALQRVERQMIVEALNQANGDIDEAARLLGMYDRQVSDRMRELGIKP